MAMMTSASILGSPTATTSDCARKLESFRNSVGPSNPVSYVLATLAAFGPASVCSLREFVWRAPYANVDELRVHDESLRVYEPSEHVVFVHTVARFPRDRLTPALAARVSMLTPQVRFDRLRDEVSTRGSSILECHVMMAFVEALAAGVYDGLTMQELASELRRRQLGTVVSKRFPDVLNEREQPLYVPRSLEDVSRQLCASGSASYADASRLVLQWTNNRGPNNPVAYATKMFLMLSPPQASTPSEVEWYRPYSEVETLRVRDEATRHFVPLPHSTFVYARARFADLTPQRAASLVAVDPTLMPDVLSSSATVKSSNVLGTQVGLSFIDDVTRGRLDSLTQDELQNEYTRRRLQNSTNNRFPNIFNES